ncbi:nicotinamide-nucleotide amidohydrolase family protein [Niabella sp. CC-SYL272]|uniref:CinA family protein n=1 Tax=Niabella agricola TaxID=2891571 RepID=UPI001F2D9A90|nr:nicotinamide-nucleotide amidohydrolase family protein [Niabella agricola]MCF3108343.1 nicotinamide-nucleotide amidohydrolase family protein [Niabella agricola]
MTDQYLNECGNWLLQRKLTIAFAESATAGRLTAEFALLPDAGKFLKGGFVCYDASLKETVLNVPGKLVEAYTPESEAVTEAITRGLVPLIPADIHVGVTGLTAPGGSESPEKPVGTMFVYGMKTGNRIFSERMVFAGSPEAIILQTISYTAKMIIDALLPDKPA